MVLENPRFMTLADGPRAAGTYGGESSFRDQPRTPLWKARLCLQVKNKLGQDAAETKILLVS